MPLTTLTPCFVVVLNAVELAGSWHRWIGHIITGLTGTQLLVIPDLHFHSCVAPLSTCDGIHLLLALWR